MSEKLTGSLDAAGLTIGIVVSRWNAEITGSLQAGAERALLACGISPDAIRILEVPGAFEIPLAAQQLLHAGVDAVVALGCVIKGETAHFEYVSEAAMTGIAQVSLAAGKPVTCGILTTYDIEQAEARAGNDEQNKGSEAALAAVEMVRLLAAVKR